MIESRTNWAGNYEYTAARLHRPETAEQVQEIVSKCSRVRALGARHSFNGIADCIEDQISLERFPGAMMLNPERNSVTIDGGVRYDKLCQFLAQFGLALHNLASLPHISVAGACATATHGSGDTNGCLATAVTSMEVVTASGELVELSRDRDGEKFNGAVVALGAMGIVTQLTLVVSSAYTVCQDVFENLTFSQMDDHYDEIFASGYSVSLFTNWKSGAFDQIWVKRLANKETELNGVADLFEATPAATHLHPIPQFSAENCTEQMGIPGPWFERLPHFRIDQVPSAAKELQSEYLVPRHHARDAIRAIASHHSRIAPLLQVSEVRTIAADNLWMSPFYTQPCIGLHFTWHQDWNGVRRLLPDIEAELARFEARPHWGKLFTMRPERLQTLYKRLPEFQALLRHYDPNGKFRNAFLNEYILD